VNLASALLQLRDLEGARPIVETVLAAGANLPWGNLLMGVMLALEGKEAEADPYLRRARETGSTMMSVLLRIGWVNLLLNRAGEAAAVFRDVLAGDDTIAEGHTGLGISLAAQGDHEAAEAALRRAIALQFFNPIAHLHLGQTLAERGALWDAVKTLRVALAQQPESAEAKALLIRIERKLAAEMAAQSAQDRDKPHPH
jgi:Flp pilus assembly protein TadD